MDKERIMQDGDAFLKAYEVLQSLDQTGKKNGVRSWSFTVGLRTFTLGPWNFAFGPWKVSFARVCGAVAALFAFSVLTIGLLHHFVWEREDQDHSAAVAAYPDSSKPANTTDPAAQERDSSVAASSMTGGSAVPLAIAGAAAALTPGETAAKQPQQEAAAAAPPGVASTTAASEGVTADLEPSPMVTEWKDWKRVQDSHKLVDFQAFLQKYPDGPYSPAAAQATQKMQWEAVDKQNPASLQAYLDTSQQGAYSAEARQRLGALLQAQQVQQARAQEENAWDSIDPRAAEALRHFLAQYPNGSHALAAQELLHRLEKQKEARELALADDNAWKTVASKDQHSLEQYLNEFPSGKHNDQARQWLTEISTTAAAAREASSREASAVIATLKKYSDAWNAKDLEDITALRPGLGRRTAKEELSSTRSIVMHIQPTSVPKIQGDRATVECIHKVDQVFSDGTEKQNPGVKMTYVLVKRGGTWLIADSR